MDKKMPALFIGHGSPLNVILDNEFTRSLGAVGKSLPRPKAIMVVSAHWLTGGGTFVTCVERPRTIYDFYGFPQELYDMEYPCPGAPAEAELAAGTVRTVSVKCDNDWGLDHASWAVLKHIYPAADVPVFEMSLDYTFNEWRPKPVQYYYDLARELSELRSRGVLIIGSGNIVHNLGLIDFRNIDAKPFAWAKEFDEQVKESLLERKDEGLIRYESMGRASALAVPTLDHYLPMIFVTALRGKDDTLTFIYEGFHYGSISMRCFQIG